MGRFPFNMDEKVIRCSHQITFLDLPYQPGNCGHTKAIYFIYIIKNAAIYNTFVHLGIMLPLRKAGIRALRCHAIGL